MMLADRVLETSATTGVGTYTLDGAPAGFQTFITAFGAATPVFYFALGNSSSDWERGFGTLAAAPDTLTRATILESSNSGAAVNWGVETKTVFVSAPSAVIDSMLKTHAAAARPAWLPANALWLDISASPHVLKWYDGADDIPLLALDATGNSSIPYRAGVAITTAATLTAGVAANNLVQLDGAGALPAVDGSALTGIGVVSEMKMIGGYTAPAKWLLCQGQAISRTTYADLFGAIGTVFGAGDGSTTFNIPDMRGRVPVGVGTGSGLTARALGAAGGEEAHVQTAAEMASHYHNQHAAVTSGGSLLTQVGTSVSGDQATGTNTGAAGSSTAANVMQPFLAINFIIYTGV